MTNKEAIETLKRNYPSKCFEQLREAVDAAISALEKQIQKKPMIKINVYNENICHLYCPTCGTWIGVMNKRLKGINMHNNENGNICAKCGQAIDTDFERWENDN